jgi:hypothetical protein
MAQISIHNLAVLRAAVEGLEELGTYFGSTVALNHWIASTRSFGLLDASDSVTDLGVSIASQLDLTNQGIGRSYLWRNVSELEKKAQVLMNV